MFLPHSPGLADVVLTFIISKQPSLTTLKIDTEQIEGAEMES